MNPRKYPRKQCPGCGRDEVAYYPETGAMVFHKCAGARAPSKDTVKLKQVGIHFRISAGAGMGVTLNLYEARALHRELSALLGNLDGVVD